MALQSEGGSKVAVRRYDAVDFESLGRGLPSRKEDVHLLDDRGRGHCQIMHAVTFWGDSMTGIGLACNQLACRVTEGKTSSE